LTLWPHHPREERLHTRGRFGIIIRLRYPSSARISLVRLRLVVATIAGFAAGAGSVGMSSLAAHGAAGSGSPP
jgi:hypothetical protein